MKLFDKRQLFLIGPRWRGPVLFCVGVLLLVSQVYAWLMHGILHSWLIGGGVGLLLIGGVAWFFYLDDQRAAKHRRQSSLDEELPSADEYDQLLDAMDHVDQDHGK